MAKKSGNEMEKGIYSPAKDYNNANSSHSNFSSNNGTSSISSVPAPLFNRNELRRRSLYRAIMAKFMSTLVFVLITIGTLIEHAHGQAPCGSTPSSSSSLGMFGLARSFGGMIFILVYCTFGFSGFDDRFQKEAILTSPSSIRPALVKFSFTIDHDHLEKIIHRENKANKISCFQVSHSKKSLGHNAAPFTVFLHLDEEGKLILIPEAIIKIRERTLRKHVIKEYFVKWKDFLVEDVTWENEQILIHLGLKSLEGKQF